MLLINTRRQESTCWASSASAVVARTSGPSLVCLLVLEPRSGRFFFSVSFFELSSVLSSKEVPLCNYCCYFLGV